VGPPGVLLYRCRACGTLDDHSRRVTDVTETVAAILRDGIWSVAWAPTRYRLLEPHRCAEGRVGVAELVGGRADPADEVTVTAVTDDPNDIERQ
jgi:hypothetical protein